MPPSKPKTGKDMANKTKIDTLVKSVYTKDELAFLNENLIDPAPGKYALLGSVDESERGEALKAIKERAALLRPRMEWCRQQRRYSNE